MKKVAMKLFCFGLMVFFLGAANIQANEIEGAIYHEPPALSSEVEHDGQNGAKADYDLVSSKLATSILNSGCYELKRVWVWGWPPRRVLRWVRVSCQQAAPSRVEGPGTTIPPH